MGRVRFKRSRIDRLNGLYIHAIDRIPAIHEFTFVVPSRDFHGVVWKNFDFRLDFRKGLTIFPLAPLVSSLMRLLSLEPGIQN